MNALEQFIAENKLNTIDAMNQLIDSGAISDNAVYPSDVAEIDRARAIDFLREQMRPIDP